MNSASWNKVSYNKLLNFVPATKKRGLHWTAYAALRQPISKALGMMMAQTDNPTVKCGTHGTVNSAVVCCHLLQKTEGVLGFVENSSEPDDLQAWCGACEEFFLNEGEMTESFRAFNNFSLVCEFCYAKIKQQHSANP